MSTKTEDNNQNDWDIDDDNDWDDWGDAEDNLPEETAQTTKDSNKIENNNTDVESKEKQSNKEKLENNNFSKEQRTTVPSRPAQQQQTTVPSRPAQQQQQQQQQQSSGWGSLFGGVVSSVLSTATELTSTVTHGLDKVIGVPDPEEMARINALHEAKVKTQHPEPTQLVEREDDNTLANANNEGSVFGLGLVTNVTSLGSKVLNTGLDTLEGIGKKTMNILQENDPLLKNKIKKLGLEQDKPNLSEILKEAKKENEQLEQSLRELSIEKTKAQLRFEVLFENNCGLVHLEALEILSKESQLKIQALKDSVTGKALEELLETINEVKELMELEDLEGEPDKDDYDKDELNEQLKQAIEDTELQIQFEDITNLWTSCCSWLSAEETKDLDVQSCFAKGITSLAETCALEMLKLHKIAELLLVKEHHSTANEVDGIVQLCKQFNIHLQAVANRFAAQLSQQFPNDSEAKSYINTLFAEMLQARQQIEKGFHLFLPIIQIGAV